MNYLYHGSDSRITKFSKPTFFFIDNPELASTYGTIVYECTANPRNSLDFAEGDDLERISENGFMLAGSSKKTRELIKKVMADSSEDEVNFALETYRRNGMSASPARIFGDWSKVIKTVEKLGYDSMTFRDESAIGARGGVFDAIMMIDPSSIEINKVIVYDDYYGEVEHEFSADEWMKMKHNSSRFECFMNDLDVINPTIMEAVKTGYELIFR